MKNLAGVIKADENIREELSLAGIELVQGERSSGEVPYSITGKLGDWKFARAWYYWRTFAPEGKGLPLEVAAYLHGKKYPHTEERETDTIYGQVIRVVGHCGCPHPMNWASLSSDGKRYVYSYHIDTQTGLNEFARFISPNHVYDKDRMQYFSNLWLIKQEQEDSDILGVLQRAAYNRHIRNRENKEWENWFMAQEDFARYEVPLHFDKPDETNPYVPLSEESLKSYLNKVAYYHRQVMGEGISSFDAWMYALDIVASHVSPSVASQNF